MAPTQPHTGLQQWLDHLSVLFPGEAVVHVGAGSGFAASRYAQWHVPQVMLFEADAGLARKIPDSISAHRGWIARDALVGASVGEQAFYVATNPNESGVIEPESLTFLWRNLRARERRMLPVTTVDTALVEAGWKSDVVDWLVVDCLPSLPVLQGAAGSLASCDVVLARVLLGSAAGPAGAGVAEVDSFLAGLGFRSVARVEERLPALATAIYVRDWKRTRPAETSVADEGVLLRESAIAQARTDAEAMLASMADKLADANERLATSEARAEALAQLNRNQEQGIAAREAEVAELKTMITERDTALAELRKGLTDKDAKVAEHNRLMAGMESQVASLQAQLGRQTREHDDEALLQALQLAESKASLAQAVQIQARLENRITEQQTRIDELTRGTQEQTELAAQRAEQVTQLNRACEELVQQATQRQARLDELARVVEEAASDKAAQASQMESLQTQLRVLQAAKEEAEKAGGAIATELEQARQALRQREQSIEEANHRISALQAGLADAQLQRDEHASRMANEQARVQQMLDGKSALDAALSRQGQLLAEHETRNAKLAEEHLQQLNLAAQRLTQVEALQAEKAAAVASAASLANLAAQRLTQVEDLQAEKAAAVASAASLAGEVARLQAAGEAERANAAELSAHLQRIAADNDEHVRQSAAQLAQFERLREENAQALARIDSQQAELAGAAELADRLQRISRDHDEHARVSRERLAHIEKLLGEAEARNARISQLEAERGELDYRQRLLDEELVKAEAQIDLIKDVVLREKAF